MSLRWKILLVCLSLVGWPLPGGPGILPAAELLPADRSPEEVIDYYIDARIREAGITAAPAADDPTLIRRTMLDLAGRTPTLSEVQAYLASDHPAKRQELVERLLASPEFVRHQATEFDTLLMAGNQGSLRDYLEQAFREQRGWDQIFRDLLSGQPVMESPEADGSKPAAAASSTRFLLSRIDDLDKLASEASSLFFGVNVSCAQCHDHPLVPDWTQEHFYGMKSFFSRSFENGGFLGERDYGLINYKTVEGEARDARLMFLTGTVVDEPPDRTLTDQQQKDEKQQLEELKKQKQPPPPPAFSRRAQLVDVALRPEERHYFSRAIVNRLWFRFFGRGLVTPLDQMHPENPPSHPELLNWLARDLVDHDYDLTRLVRALVLSQAYARDSRWNPTSEPPAPDLFAVAEVRPLTPAQYAVVLRMATTNPDQWDEHVSAEDRQKRVDQVVGAARGLVSLFEQPGPDFQVGVAEALLLSNSQRIERELLRDASDSLLGKLKQLDDRSQQVATAIWNIYGRAPTDDEQRVLEEFLAERQQSPLDGCRQLVWALLCSSPCRFNF